VHGPALLWSRSWASEGAVPPGRGQGVGRPPLSISSSASGGCPPVTDLERKSRAWLRARARVLPGVLLQSPPWVRGVFDHAWAPVEALAREIRLLPIWLWDYLLSYQGGFVAISSGQSRYTLGPVALRGSQVQNVAYVSVEDLARGNERTLHVLGHLVDHHLGCGGDAESPWLSDGGGTTPVWQEAGARLPRIFGLGYAADEVARSNPRDYFAQSLALYCRDRQGLEVADPQITKWLRSTLWAEGFWRAVRRETGRTRPCAADLAASSSESDHDQRRDERGN
jgi:hypothetical protein